MDKDATRPGKTVVRILAISWIFYAGLLDENPATAIVFAALGLLLLLFSEFAMDAFDIHSSSMGDKHRAGWW